MNITVTIVVPNQRYECAFGIPRVSVPRHLSSHQWRGTETPHYNGWSEVSAKNFTHPFPNRTICVNLVKFFLSEPGFSGLVDFQDCEREIPKFH